MILMGFIHTNGRRRRRRRRFRLLPQTLNRECLSEKKMKTKRGKSSQTCAPLYSRLSLEPGSTRCRSTCVAASIGPKTLSDVGSVQFITVLSGFIHISVFYRRNGPFAPPECSSPR